MFYEIKVEIAKEIIRQHGSYSKFIERTKDDLGLTPSKLSIMLNPSKNTSLVSIGKLLKHLNKELKLVPANKFKVAKTG